MTISHVKFTQIIVTVTEKLCDLSSLCDPRCDTAHPHNDSQDSFVSPQSDSSLYPQWDSLIGLHAFTITCHVLTLSLCAVDIDLRAIALTLYALTVILLRPTLWHFVISQGILIHSQPLMCPNNDSVHLHYHPLWPHRDSALLSQWLLYYHNDFSSLILLYDSHIVSHTRILFAVTKSLCESMWVFEAS